LYIEPFDKSQEKFPDGYKQQTQASMKRKVVVITTGGTIEKIYDEDSGTLSNRGSHLRQMLKRLRLPYTHVEHHDLMSKDSLDMTEEDRKKLVATVEKLLNTIPVIILHGTDTMQVTAERLYETFTDLSAPIILTGAMKPFGFEDSDALQNFTEALMASELVKPGVYISMHGKIHVLPGVRKNRQHRTFEKSDDPLQG
jgi:L-asparaginase